MKFSEAVANRIFFLMREHGISQYELEQKTGIDHKTMCSILYGNDFGIATSHLFAISKAFGISLRRFFNDTSFEKFFDIN